MTCPVADDFDFPMNNFIFNFSFVSSFGQESLEATFLQNPNTLKHKNVFKKHKVKHKEVKE